VTNARPLMRDHGTRHGRIVYLRRGWTWRPAVIDRYFYTPPALDAAVNFSSLQ